MDIHDMLLNRECVAIRHKIAVIFWVGKRPKNIQTMNLMERRLAAPYTSSPSHYHDLEHYRLMSRARVRPGSGRVCAPHRG
jgi:hypothetical protein